MPQSTSLCLLFELYKYSCDLDAGEVCLFSQSTSKLLYLKTSTLQTAGMPGSTQADGSKKCSHLLDSPAAAAALCTSEHRDSLL